MSKNLFYFNVKIINRLTHQQYERNYNYGDGFNVDFGTNLRYKNWNFSLRSENFFLFTLQGYPQNFDFAQENLTPADLFFQGDKSNTMINAATWKLNYYFLQNLCFSAEFSLYNRLTNYRYFPAINALSQEIKLMMGYSL